MVVESDENSLSESSKVGMKTGDGLTEINTNTTETPSKTAVKSNDSEQPEIKKGKLDLSRRGYGKLSLRYKDVYNEVKYLDISHNNFKFINGLNLFANCVEIRANHNCLERLSSFQSLKNVLQVLDASNNMIINCENLATLWALITLNASHNRISQLPLLDRLSHLKHLDLSSNRFEALPRLCRLNSLEVLNLNNNRIASLDDCSRLLPADIKSLDIGNNAIADLRQAKNLSCLRSLDSLMWSGNPCVSFDSRTFTYRPYLYSCCIGSSLNVVDGFALKEPEIIKGELLCTMNQTKRAQTNAELCALLAKECPIEVDLNDISSLSSFDDRLLRVLEKRREYMSATTDGDDEFSRSSILDRCASKLNQSQSRVQSQPRPPQARSRSSSYTRIENESNTSVEVNHPSDKNNNRNVLHLDSSSISDQLISTENSQLLHTPKSRSESPPVSASSMTSSSTFVLFHQESCSESISVAQYVYFPKTRSPRGIPMARYSTVKSVTQPTRGRLCSRISSRNPKYSMHRYTSNDSENSATLRPKGKLTTSQRKSVTGIKPKAGKTTPRNSVSSRVRLSTYTTTPKSTSATRTRTTVKPSVVVHSKNTYSKAQLHAVVIIQLKAWWRAVRTRRAWRVRLMEMRLRRYAKEKQQISGRLAAISAECEQLSRIVEQQSQWMQDINNFVLLSQEKMESRLAEHEECLRRCLPVPAQVEFIRNSPTEITLQWQDIIMPDKRYVLYVDGQDCGTIRAQMKKAKIQDLNPAKESVVEIQCVHGNNKGSKSMPLIIPPMCEQICTQTDRDVVDESGDREGGLPEQAGFSNSVGDSASFHESAVKDKQSQEKQQEEETDHERTPSEEG
ncbi:unnamed protein product [Anisakis simplex]|uniref:Centrosomal protein of 97 kDa (inferred by orthology to a human protein) n=1 Tax=Anisakis simplex TaxID=6269 RepID=A0A158PNN5_ANISI|nr:unnamed protein product [Anisakis simplex]